jgi:UDP-3-O-[3-hydroxymyristoyl] N-acetylglucosamine deacetylase
MNEIRVLVVDDEGTFLMAIRRILDGPELLVETADNFDDAIALIDKQDFNFVITDLRLTDAISTEGLDILSHIKERSPGTKVIILTGYGNSRLMEKAYSMGANLFLEKPVSGIVLRSILVNSGGT